ncbi:MAG: hypothetical protein PHD55_04815 [Methanoregula sp.]|nr:hypothetical protein [Methanoregula sp.]
MAGSFSQYLDLKALDHEIGAIAHTPVTTLYLGLSTTTISGDGTGITEPTIGTYNYARVAITNNVTNFPAASIVSGKAQKTNGVEFDFPQALGAWGTITYLFLSDAATGGNMVAYAQLMDPTDPTTPLPKTITAGDTLKFPIGTLKFTLG